MRTIRPRPLLLGLTIAIAWATAAPAAVLDRVGVYLDGWYAGVQGDARIDGAVPGTPFDLVDDVGLDDVADAFEAGAWFHPAGPHRVRVAALALSTEGSATLASAIEAGGVALAPGEVVRSDLELRLYQAHYGYSVLNMDVVNVAVLAGIDWLDTTPALAFTGGSREARLEGAIPVIGLTAQVQPVGFFRAYGEASYADWDVSGLDSEILDLRLRVEFYIGHVFGLGAGYRDLETRVENDEGLLDARFDGYQLYVLLRF